MKLTLAHEQPTQHSTPGRLMCDDGWCCFTLEVGRPLRHGTYDVVSGFSAALHRTLLAFRNDAGVIVGFIHPGGQEIHPPAHVLIGMDRAIDLIVDSRKAYKELELRVNESNEMFGESISIEVKPLDDVLAPDLARLEQRES